MSLPAAASSTMASILEQSTAELSDVTDQEFDYVIIGGGTSGLALAARLAEDPTVTVAVLETGGMTHIYDTIMLPAHFGREHGNPELVYKYESVPQATTKRPFSNERGRGLGGSSAVNFMFFQKPPAYDVDNWERLGATGWNWDKFHAAIKRAETFHPPPPDQAEKFGFEFDPASHGTDGPIHTSYPKVQPGGDNLVKQTFVNLGCKVTKDPAGGDILGIGSYVSSIDPRTNTRSYAATGYFLDKANNPNLKVLPYATARRVLFDEVNTPRSDNLTANGVEFDCSGATHRVRAKREVIIAAGAMRSSAILELSGIGNAKILDAAGVATKVHNPSVGENVQEHTKLRINYELNTQKHDFKTVDALADPVVAKEQRQLYNEGKGLYLSQIAFIAWLSLKEACSPSRFAELIAAEEARIAEVLRSPDVPEGLAEQYALQIERLKRDDQPDVEFAIAPMFSPSTSLAAAEPGKSYIALSSNVVHPFSRGSIHIKSSDPYENAEMDPRIFDHQLDLEEFVELIKFSRKFSQTEPFKDMIVKEVAPGPSVVTDEEMRDYILKNVASTWHTIGSCAMRPREKGGVVDASLKVYGTSNLRVGDISIIPLHIAAHTQTSSYAIAEQHIIKAAYGSSH